jgi:hypothetical protein
MILTLLQFLYLRHAANGTALPEHSSTRRTGKKDTALRGLQPLQFFCQDKERSMRATFDDQGGNPSAFPQVNDLK